MTLEDIEGAKLHTFAPAVVRYEDGTTDEYEAASVDEAGGIWLAESGSYVGYVSPGAGARVYRSEPSDTDRTF